jgi:hypothetical protein
LSIGGGKGWRSGDLFEKVFVPKVPRKDSEKHDGKTDNREKAQEFEERYISRGRDDDWVKSQFSEKLDTRCVPLRVLINVPCLKVGNHLYNTKINGSSHLPPLS